MAVKSEQLQWLPGGSEYQVPSVEKTAKTYTSFSCSQDTLPPFKKDPIISRYPDITLARLRPGQVIDNGFTLVALFRFTFSYEFFYSLKHVLVEFFQFSV